MRFAVSPLVTVLSADYMSAIFPQDQTSDLEALGHAMRRGVLMLDKLERAGVCGPRLSPPREISLSDMPKLIKVFFFTSTDLYCQHFLNHIIPSFFPLCAIP